MTPRKSGLGKGLEALIPITEEGTAPQGVTEVSLAAITPNPHQPRSPIRDQDLVELAASIEEHGIIQPLIVAQAPGGYQLIAGERRWRAARLAGLSEVPVIVKDAAPGEMLELALVENVQRADLNALEEATAYRQLTQEFGLTQAQVARRVGKSRAAVANTLRLLKAALPVQKALLEDKISEGHARALLGLAKAEAQEAALGAVLAQGMNVRQTEELVSTLQQLKKAGKVWEALLQGKIGVGHAQALLALKGPEKQEAALVTITRRGLSVQQTEDLVQSWLAPGQGKRQTTREVPPRIRAVETNLRNALSAKLEVKHSEKGGGRIVIYYSDEQELGDILERIVGGE